MSQTGPSMPKTFEFTKRKRWADLLISELADGINLILSESCIVLYCAPAVTEITGWKDTDLLDRDFTDFIATSDDQGTFRASFDESLQQNSSLHSFMRIKCTGNLPSYSAFPEGMLFEIRGEPRSTETEGAFLFLVAKPYPSRNTEIQNTYLDLKIENDQLQRRRLELNNRLSKKSVVPRLPPIVPGHIYATSPIRGTSAAGGLLGVGASGAYYPGGLPGFDTLLSSSFNSTLYDEANYQPPLQGSIAEDESEESSRRKKVKKSPVGEQYVCVTCGRTDSPEWRKGPLGPKTLCNACGLRWAKQTRSGKLDNTQVGEGGYGA